MKLQHYHNNAYDMIVLRDDNDTIIGAWNEIEAREDYDAATPTSILFWEPNDAPWEPVEGVDVLVSEKLAVTHVAVSSKLLRARGFASETEALEQVMEWEADAPRGPCDAETGATAYPWDEWVRIAQANGVQPISVLEDAPDE